MPHLQQERSAGFRINAFLAKIMALIDLLYAKVGLMIVKTNAPQHP